MAAHHHPEAGTAAPDRTGAPAAVPQRRSTPASGQQSARGPPTTLAHPSSLTPGSLRGKLFPFTAPSQLVDLYGASPATTSKHAAFAPDVSVGTLVSVVSDVSIVSVRKNLPNA